MGRIYFAGARAREPVSFRPSSARQGPEVGGRTHSSRSPRTPGSASTASASASAAGEGEARGMLRRAIKSDQIAGSGSGSGSHFLIVAGFYAQPLCYFCSDGTYQQSDQIHTTVFKKR